MRLFFGFYKLIVGPALHTLGGVGFGCRYHPTCSEYSHQAYTQFNFFKATQLSLVRILRCNPWQKAEFEDPLPAKEIK